VEIYCSHTKLAAKALKYVQQERELTFNACIPVKVPVKLRRFTKRQCQTRTQEFGKNSVRYMYIVRSAPHYPLTALQAPLSAI
jgi:hypothetical protein